VENLPHPFVREVAESKCYGEKIIINEGDDQILAGNGQDLINGGESDNTLDGGDDFDICIGGPAPTA
jgi:Ca2+-binding RTX toxin-like protein